MMSEVVGIDSSREESWLRQLLSDHYRHVLAYTRRRLPVDDADEVTADVFTVAWRRRDEIPDDVPELAWLYGVARNRVRLAERAQERRSQASRRLFADRTAALSVAGSTGESPQHTGVDDRAERVRRALAKLKPREQEVLRLLTWEELSHRDTAHVLGCSVNAVAIRAHRARQSLARALLENKKTGRL